MSRLSLYTGLRRSKVFRDITYFVNNIVDNKLSIDNFCAQTITVLLERRFLLGDGVCCEDELDDLFSRSFLLDIRGCRVYRQILASMFHYQDIRIQKWRKNSTLGVLPVHKFTQRQWHVLSPWLLDPIPHSFINCIFVTFWSSLAPVLTSWGANYGDKALSSIIERFN